MIITVLQSLTAASRTAGVIVIDAIPRSAAGKMLRRELREMAKAELQKTKAKL